MKVVLEYILKVVTNYYLISAVAAWLVAQILKVVTGVFKTKKFTLIELFFGTGGMPSSHSASVTALACAVGIRAGLDTPAFAICAILAMIVMRDATGMRRQVGEQAKVLNEILQNLVGAKDLKSTQKALNELAGHTPMQVAAGAVVGIAVPFLVNLIPVFH